MRIICAHGHLRNLTQKLAVFLFPKMGLSGYLLTISVTSRVHAVTQYFDKSDQITIYVLLLVSHYLADDLINNLSSADRLQV